MKVYIQIFFILISFFSYSQKNNVSGVFKAFLGDKVKLIGFNNYKTVELGQSVVDSLGRFKINYPKEYNGMGVLQTYNNGSLLLLLTEQEIVLKGESFVNRGKLSYTVGEENKLFLKYAKRKKVRDASVSALKYLVQLYNNNNLDNKERLLKMFSKEINFLNQKDKLFLESLNSNEYLAWFIPIRQLISDMVACNMNNSKSVAAYINIFRNIDFNSPNFKNSGLLKDLIDGHYSLLQKIPQSKDSIISQINLSTKYIINNLTKNDSLLNIVSKNLFNNFEKYSLFKASEYLSVSLLNNKQCSLDKSLVSKLESYRKLKVGAVAPNIVLNNKTLASLKTNKLVVFGFSKCPTCKKDLSKLLKYYNAFKSKGVEVVYISLDTNKTVYERTYANVPWLSFCNYKGWETKSVKDYYVSGTPTYFLLDSGNKILVRPNSIEHSKVWIDSKL